MTTGLKPSKAELECPICLNSYDLVTHVPLKLELCSHTFCSKCIINIRSNNAGVIVCPKDKILTRVPSSALPKNLPLIKHLERLKYLSEDKCDSHGERLGYFCKTDNKLLCINCLQDGSHQEHEIISEDLFVDLMLESLDDPRLHSPRCLDRNDVRILKMVREGKE